MIFGIFVLLGAAIATFYLFNTGQMTAEKTKLVNTADAVAYSAGVMHARALNFEAYTNRALLANEATIAQMVSIASWLEYSKEHIDRVPAMMCYYGSYTPIPVWLATERYALLCYAISNYPLGGEYAVEVADLAFNATHAGAIAVYAAEIAKKELKIMQATAATGLFLARGKLMREVADANYQDNGSVSVDTVPLLDNWTSFDGGAFISKRSGNQRDRMRSVIFDVVGRDGFVTKRAWSDKSPWPCSIPIGEATRTGATQLRNFDRWEANDDASYRVRELKLRGLSLRCRTTATYGLGSGSLRTSSTEGQEWYYSGVPEFYELSDAALDYSAASGGPRLQFSIRVTRANGDTRTSGNASLVKPTGRLDRFDSAAAGGVLAAVSTSEVFFERQREENGAVELGSLFNPYWQVHLVNNPPDVTAAAWAKQGATP